jgi:hypothetical protein
MSRRILVTCSRNWQDWGQARQVLRAVFALAPDGVLVSGHARKGDQDLERIWTELGGLTEPHPVTSWYRDGRFNSQAGFERNERMCQLGAQVCLAFIAPCRKEDCPLRGKHGSHGAVHCADFAEYRCGIPARRFGDPIILA